VKQKIISLNKLVKAFLLLFIQMYVFSLSAQVIQPINSPLANGIWRKLQVTENGIYKISGAEIKAWGWRLADITPNTIKLYSHHGGMLDERNNVPKSYNLDEISILVEDGGDGIFNEQDYILFWAEGPHKWLRDVNGYYFQTNLYSDNSNYFMTFGGNLGKRISSSNSISGSAEKVISTYDFLHAYEKDLFKIYQSGRDFHGDRFIETGSKQYNINVPNPVPGIPAKLKIGFAGEGQSSSVSYVFNGLNLGTVSGLFGSDEAIANRYTQAENVYTINNLASNNQLNINYSKAGISSIGYLDQFTLIAKSEMVLSNQLELLNEDAKSFQTVEYRMNHNGGTYQLWDVSNPDSVKLLNAVRDASQYSFKFNNQNKIPRIISTDGSGFKQITDGGSITNQNIAASGQADLVIVAHPLFWAEAQRLAAHRRAHDGLTVNVFTPQTIYNEFSTGQQDITAIRDFMRYLYYQPGSKLKYLLLFGDASYDYKDRIEGNTNFVPTYQSKESQSDISSYCSDDYFAFLDDTDGLWINHQRLEISVGRLPASNEKEAKDLVDKLLRYDSPKAFGKWRNKLTFLADDVDESWDIAHFNYSESLISTNNSNHANYNNSKIYMDAYQEVLLGGAGAYPEVNREIDETMNQGTLIFNYIGHGGTEGIAKERAVTFDQTEKWKNLYQMPVFVTATCELASYDNPKKRPIGETMLLNPQGGPVAMLTTTRIVYSAANFSLNQGIWINNILANNSADRIGDVYLRTKNRDDSYSNDRRFTLLGDPSMRIAKPEHKIIIDSFNGKAISDDTLSALSLVNFSGHLERRSGGLWSTFNGTVDITIYDKPIDEKTLGNGTNGVEVDYKHLRSIIYSGKVEATNGKFNFSFVVPKDINYNVGNAKISLYAHNEVEDAAGNNITIKVGGANENPDEDDLGPEIKLYMDSRNFVNGGFTSENPTLIADLYDDHGINLSSSGIGRDLLVTIDKGTDFEQKFVVNDFYSSASGSYKKGEVLYALKELSKGNHTLHLKAWDTYNNSSEASIKFVVGDKSDQFNIYNVRSIPNPFTSKPTIILDHNRSGYDLKITNELFDSRGNKVLSHQMEVNNAASNVNLQLSNNDNWYNKISSGVYILRTIVTTSIGETKTITTRLIAQ
jgi:hypothetical protein